MAQYNTPSRYTPQYLSTLSPNYRKRIESALRRNPNLSITEARGHRPSLTERAARLRQAPRERYTPEYLEQLSPSYRRSIERELRESQESQREFIMPGSLRSRAFRLYVTHLKMLGIKNVDDINTKDSAEYTYREEFRNSWKNVRTTSQRQAWIFHQQVAIQKTLNWKKTHTPQPSIGAVTVDATSFTEVDNLPVEIDGVFYQPDDYEFEYPEDEDLNDMPWEEMLPMAVGWYHAI